MGPFLDQNNETVKNGELQLSSDGLYLGYAEAFDIMLDVINQSLKSLQVRK